MQRQVENGPTSSLRQIAMPPLTERGTSPDDPHGSDRSQPRAMVGPGSDSLPYPRHSPLQRRRPSFCRLVVATIPMAFLQASNTKNDVVVAMWTCLLSFWVLQLKLEPSLSWRRVFMIGLAFGALILTKGTGIIFGLPIATLMLFLLLRHHLRRAMRALLLMTLVVLAVNAGAFLRNFQAFGTPFPEDPAIHGGSTVINQEFSSRAFLSNMVRNIAPHFTTPNDALNESLTELVLRLHAWLGLDVNDPRTTFLEGFRAYAFTQEARTQRRRSTAVCCAAGIARASPRVAKPR
jgi:hypothetical protein